MTKSSPANDLTGDLTSLCMHYVLILRSLAFWGHGIILWMFIRRIDQPYPYQPVVLILIALGILTFVSSLWVKKNKSVSDTFVFGQLMIDIFMLTGLLYFTGGAANPFVSLFMLPVTFAAAMLKPVYIWITASTAIACYTLLLKFNQPLLVWRHHGDGFEIHVWGMWYGFLLSAGLVAYFVTRIGKTLKEREMLLAKARTQALEADKIIALGSLAAGTAHELGTPLGTIAILSKDLETSYESDPVLHKKLGLLRGEVYRCKDILARMAMSAGENQADYGESTPLDFYFEGLIDEWQVTHPDTKVTSEINGKQPATEIIADHTVTQAIMNVLNNAVDASPKKINFVTNWDNESITIQVHDYGPGLPGEIAEKLGVVPFLSTKTPGKSLGLGLYLAKNRLEQLGGQITLENRSVPSHDIGDMVISGVTATITLPLSALKTHG